MTLYQPKQSLTRWLIRFVIGRCLDGQRRTDATFLLPASQALTVHGRACRWAWRPGWQRASVRLAVVLVLSGAAYGYLFDRTATVAAAFAALAVTTGWQAYTTYRTLRLWSHRRRVIYPVWFILAGIVGYPLNESRYLSVPHVFAGLPHYSKRERPDKFLTIPRDYQTNDKTVVRFDLPYTWEAEDRDKARVTRTLARHLGGDWSATWSTDTSPKFVALCHQPRPPKSVTLAEFIAHVDSVPDSSLALGIGASGQLIAINLDSDAPHIALSMGTGGGKSDTVALIIAMLVRRGCERIDVIDPKRVSHNWARGLPGVYIHRYVAGQMEAIHNARLRMDSRYDAMDADDAQAFSRQVIIIEEQNSLMQDLKDYWSEYRASLDSAERAKCPRENPAIADLRYILNKGRQCRINVISIYQRMSAPATGGGDARENYGAKILCRCSSQTWKILVGTRMLPMSRIPGRAYVIIGEDIREVQRAHAGISKPDGSADKEATARLRDFALNGQPDTARTDSPRVTTVTADSAPDDASELVTLAEACQTGIIPMKYGAIQKARKRDREFPAAVPRGCALAYRAGDLRAWHANRPRAGSRERAPAGR
jgi:hypothetical protein